MLQGKVFLSVDATDGQSSDAFHPQAHGGLPDEQITVRETLGRVFDEIAGLDELQQRILRKAVSMTPREVAKEEGLRVDEVNTELSELRSLLKHLMDE